MDLRVALQQQMEFRRVGRLRVVETEQLIRARAEHDRRPPSAASAGTASPSDAAGPPRIATRELPQSRRAWARAGATASGELAAAAAAARPQLRPTAQLAVLAAGEQPPLDRLDLHREDGAVVRAEARDEGVARQQCTSPWLVPAMSSPVRRYAQHRKVAPGGAAPHRGRRGAAAAAVVVVVGRVERCRARREAAAVGVDAPEADALGADGGEGGLDERPREREQRLRRLTAPRA